MGVGWGTEAHKLGTDDGVNGWVGKARLVGGEFSDELRRVSSPELPGRDHAGRRHDGPRREDSLSLDLQKTKYRETRISPQRPSAHHA